MNKPYQRWRGAKTDVFGPYGSWQMLPAWILPWNRGKIGVKKRRVWSKQSQYFMYGKK
jgi:hypothetical protein